MIQSNPGITKMERLLNGTTKDMDSSWQCSSRIPITSHSRFHPTIFGHSSCKDSASTWPLNTKNSNLNSLTLTARKSWSSKDTHSSKNNKMIGRMFSKISQGKLKRTLEKRTMLTLCQPFQLQLHWPTQFLNLAWWTLCRTILVTSVIPTAEFQR